MPAENLILAVHILGLCGSTVQQRRSRGAVRDPLFDAGRVRRLRRALGIAGLSALPVTPAVAQSVGPAPHEGGSSAWDVGAQAGYSEGDVTRIVQAANPMDSRATTFGRSDGGLLIGYH